MPTSNDILRGTSLHVRRQIGDLLDALLPGGAAAPAAAEYILKSSNASLPNGRVLTDTATVTADYSTTGQVKLNATGSSYTADELTLTLSNTTFAGKYPWVEAVHQVGHSFVVGNAIYRNGSGTWAKAINNDQTKMADGMVVASSGADDFVVLKGEGAVTLTTGQWNAVTGGSGGLTREYYWLDVTAGNLTLTRPAAGYQQPLGQASSTTTMDFFVGPVADAVGSGFHSPLSNNGEIWVYAGGVDAALAAPTPGQVLVAAGTTNKLRWEQGYPDSRYRHRYDEDFTGNVSTTMGQERLSKYTDHTGGTNSTPGPIGSIGYYLIGTNNEPNGYAGLAVTPGLTSGIGFPTRYSSTGLNLWRMSWFVYLGGTASDGTNTYTSRIGLLSDIAQGASQTNAVYLEYTHGTNSGNWVIREYVATSAQTPTSSSTAPVLSTYSMIELVLSGTTFTFYQNGVSIGSISTNSMSDSAQMLPAITIEKSVGTSGRVHYWEHFTHETEYTTPLY